MHLRILGVELYNRPPSIDVPSIGDSVKGSALLGEN